jgi:predicted nucleotidyltransferase
MSQLIPGELRDVLERLVDVLNARATKYALIGGLAVGARGRMRATQDIDLMLTIPQLELPRLLESLAEQGFQLDLYKSIAAWNHEHLLDFTFGLIRIDWIKAIIPPFQHILDRARWENIGGMRISVADPEGLILLKLIAFRPRDQEDIRGILAANPGLLDLDWVRGQWSELSTSEDPKTEQFEQLVREFYQERSS